MPSLKEHHNKLSLSSIEKLLELQEKRIERRNEFLESQRRSQYKNEYNRLYGAMVSKTIRGLPLPSQLRARHDHIQRTVSQMFGEQLPEKSKKTRSEP
jgi:hypothetical protein